MLPTGSISTINEVNDQSKRLTRLPRQSMNESPSRDAAEVIRSLGKPVKNLSLSTLQITSMGFRSGEYAGRNTGVSLKQKLQRLKPNKPLLRWRTALRHSYLHSRCGLAIVGKRATHNYMPVDQCFRYPENSRHFYWGPL